MNKPLPPFFIITGSCVRSQTFTPKYTSTETWVRYSDFVDYFPVALDECAEDKVALAEENARLKAEVQRDTEIHRRNTAMWKDDCEYHHAENARLKADAQLVVKHLGEACADNLQLKAEVVELADALKLASEVGIKVADEVTRLKAEVERLRASSFVTAVPVEQYEKLKAEVERLKAEKDQAECDYDNCQKRKVSIDNHRFDLFTENKNLKAEVERLDTLCKQLMNQHSDISCENIMLRKAGDELLDGWIGMYGDHKGSMAQDYIKLWNAAKEGKPTK